MLNVNVEIFYNPYPHLLGGLFTIGTSSSELFPKSKHTNQNSIQ